MLISEGVQTSKEMEKKYSEERIVKEGMELFKKQKEEARRRKVKEQQEMKEMLERYWPWGRATDAKPRGLRNLRLEELFPNKDYQNAKRFVGTLDLGRPGCGAPLVRDGQKVTRTKEDPMLRFQLGNKDLRRVVDNTLRYKTNRDEQMEYKKELDQLVEEKKRNQLRQKLEEAEREKRQFLKTPPWGWRGPGGRPWRHPNTIGLGFLRSLGWSNEATLKKLDQQALAQKYADQRNYENFKNSKLVPPNRVVKLDPIINATNAKKPQALPVKNRKLSSLSNNKENGVELVDLLAKDRRTPIRAALCSTDVTQEKIAGKSCIWNRQGSAYLKELTQQMVNKRQEVQERKMREDETSRRHFSTWSSFWGKPGHGAPRSAIKKGAIDRLLYPQMVPIGVA